MRPLQKEIIEALKVKASINVEEEIKRSINFMKEYLLAHSSMSTLILGISGGQDSTLAGRLAQMAIEELRAETGQENYQFIAIRLPYGKQVDEDDAQKALAFIQPDSVLTINIQASTDGLVEEIERNGLTISDYNKGNIKARERMVAQYAVAGQLNGVVIGTDHAAESVTGFYTKYGDGAADIMPLWRLNKEQGRRMLEALGAPGELYLKIPTADLEEDKPQLADEDALGVSYDVIDAYLRGESVADSEAEIIENWYTRTQHKRHLPINVYDDFWK